MLILEVDMGNTWTKWRIRDGVNITRRGKNPSAEFPATDLLALQSIARIRYASVCSDALTDKAAALLSSRLGVDVERAKTKSMQSGLQNSYAAPEDMGVDRWLAMLAAYHTAKAACLVVSCGTAVTIDLVGPDGKHAGGYILPGLVLMRSVLLANTGRIRFEPGIFDMQRNPGTSTAAAVEHGAVHAVLAAIESACGDCVSRWGSCEMFMTGGDAEPLSKLVVLARGAVHSRYIEELAMDGLQFALP